ncbi:MAG: hypothetical protein RIM84_19115 [Alphaproteobacteria bacterium]
MVDQAVQRLRARVAVAGFGARQVATGPLIEQLWTPDRLDDVAPLLRLVRPSQSDN